MILLVCDSYEPSVDDVIDWLIYYQKPFFRINTSDFIEGVNIQLNDEAIDEINIRYSGKDLDVSKVSFYWYKRGMLKFRQEMWPPEAGRFGALMDAQIGSELYGIEHYLNSCLKNIPHINSYFDNGINKLEVLRLARSVGLLIPDTLVTSNRDRALEFCNKHRDRIITKNVQNGYYLETDDFKYYTHTIQIKGEDIQQFPERFVPALFQNMLDKKYELRIFYLDGQCYSSVIFSQNDPKTKIDFRNYNHEKPNRVCPFRLPENVETKIVKLMRRLDMLSGSIDIVVTRDLEYVFLEVNPIGQFKQVSIPCNYKLGKLIADKISKRHEPNTISKASGIYSKSPG